MKRFTNWIIGSLLLGSALPGAPQSEARVRQTESSFPTPKMPAYQGGQFFGVHAYLSLLTKRMAEERARDMNKDRQKRLEAETNRLVGLVGELRRDVRDNKEISLGVLSRRAAEIEKLARSVQDRMKG